MRNPEQTLRNKINHLCRLCGWDKDYDIAYKPSETYTDYDDFDGEEYEETIPGQWTVTLKKVDWHMMRRPKCLNRVIRLGYYWSRKTGSEALDVNHNGMNCD